MATLRVGLCIEASVLESGDAARSLAGSDILVFPEMVDSGYRALKDGARAHRFGDPLLERFALASTTIAPYCIAGSVYLAEPPLATSNTSLVFHHGRRIHRYDKIHLFRPAGDHQYFRPGKQIGTFPLTSGGVHLRAGVIICYDLRFPEIVRAMARMGLQVLFVPARWPSVRDEVWHTLLKARAIENQIFVIGCNAHGAEGGSSYAFDPLGRSLFEKGSDEKAEAFAVTLDLDAFAEAHRLHRNLDEAVVLRSERLHRKVSAKRKGGR
ncbi:MAG TPA: nitrilase-related carbon-nitrogen hydrolase [Bacteroidota bacterium]|nr:nitrilase-related carbon-nitrogen hydrolase [Bacteroidota bacterium]